VAEPNGALFDKIADEFIDSGEVQPGTMMGFPCLRVRGTYIACKDKNTGALIVKLNDRRVKSLIDSGHARPFQPAGHLFRQWAAMEVFDESLWRGVLREARRLAEEA
jgi:hypothetical protein